MPKQSGFIVSIAIFCFFGLLFQRDGIASGVEVEPIQLPEFEEVTEPQSVKDSFGVLTEEEHPLRFFISPRMGYGANFGLAGISVLPDLTLGGEVGLLISDQLCFNVFYSSSDQNRLASDFGLHSDFLWSERSLGVGSRLFLFGASSWIHPYFGGGLSWLRGTLSPMGPVFQAGLVSGGEIEFNRLGGFGEVGTEINLTRAVVASVHLRVSGVVSSSAKEGAVGNQELRDLGNSVSRSAANLLGAGVGIYF